MKKLLVLTLVLGMASLLNAALIIDVPAEANVGEDFAVVISGDGLAPGIYFDGGLYGNGAALVKGSAVAAGAGPSGLVGSYNSWNGYEFTVGEAVDDTILGNNPINAETWITFTGNSAVEGLYTFELWDYAVDGNAATVTGSINIVPEPMTMALLGLGGLFLRRRK